MSVATENKQSYVEWLYTITKIITTIKLEIFKIERQVVGEFEEKDILTIVGV